MRVLPTCLLALALSFAASGASAQLFKWVDEDGVVNYGDWPPYGVKVQPITHGTVSSVSGAPKQPAPLRDQPRPSRRGSGAVEENITVVVAQPPGSTDDVDYAGTYAPYYGYPERRAAAAAAIDRPRPEQPVAKPILPINPAIAEMPLRSRR